MATARMRSSTRESETDSATLLWWPMTGLLRTGPAEFPALGILGLSFGLVDVKPITEDPRALLSSLPMASIEVDAASLTDEEDADRTAVEAYMGVASAVAVESRDGADVLRPEVTVDDVTRDDPGLVFAVVCLIGEGTAVGLDGPGSYYVNHSLQRALPGSEPTYRS